MQATLTLIQPAQRNAGVLLAWLQAFRRRLRERRMATALYELDDALLKDIGLYRGEIPWVVRNRCAHAMWS